MEADLSASSRERMSRRDSLYENYVFLEAVTVRKRLQKLRRGKSTDGEREREREEGGDGRSSRAERARVRDRQWRLYGT